MLTIARLFISLFTAQVGEMRSHAGRKLAYAGILAFFGLLVLVFGLAAATTALTAVVGLLYAFLIMAGAALLCGAIVIVLMKAADRKHRRLAEERDEMRGRLKQLAMMTALGGATGGKTGFGKMLGLGIVGLATLAAVRSARRGERD
ncbi:hypothetical protein [Amaricoccus solimangrovi]|uniref:Uncharacterized protein n=1 Tax=Amaricoccus solimangrovi TaxID=2589815 RepID=A0A501WU93_9RHOB|nr:hypothetical protein [Amaricoccus solimangrovi]TPE49406.1 hypothetical protein FJM51_14875 [Amaricoccus solimangrovi]